MVHHFLVLHFGVQCPWQPWVAEQARKAAKCLSGRADVVDVTRRLDLATRYHLFFPFITIIDEIIRLPSPTRAEELAQIAVEGFIPPPLTPVLHQPEARAVSVMSLTATNIVNTCRLCIPPEEGRGCLSKVAWVTRITRRVPGNVIGFIAYHNDQVVGAVEFLPTALVPYPLPEKAPEIAFITCLYSLENGSDYRGQVLESLVEYLQETACREVQVITGKRTPYPNGPEDFFAQFGFQTVCGLGNVTLREGEDELILLRKMIRACW